MKKVWHGDRFMLPGSLYGMGTGTDKPMSPESRFDFTEDMNPDQLQRYLVELKDRGVDITAHDIVDAYEASERASGLADAWAYVDPGYVNESAHRAIEEATEAYLAAGGTITVIE